MWPRTTNWLSNFGWCCWLLYVCPLKLQYLIDPVFELWNPSVHAGLIWFGASNTPWYDSGQEPSFIGPLNNHRTTRVTLSKHMFIVKVQIVQTKVITYFARIETTFLPSRAYKYIWYVLNISCRPVHSFTNRIVYYRDCDFL